MQRCTDTMERLTEQQCWELLRVESVGRIAFVGEPGLVIRPVNYAVLGHELLLRTTFRSELAYVARQERSAAFEVDRLDRASHAGWSVLLQGPLRQLLSNDGRVSRALQLVSPWPGGDRYTALVFTPVMVSGRRVGAPQMADAG